MLLTILFAVCLFSYWIYRKNEIKKFTSCVSDICEQYDRMNSFEIAFYQKKSAYDWVMKKLPSKFFYYLPIQLNIHNWLTDDEVRELLKGNELKCA